MELWFEGEPASLGSPEVILEVAAVSRVGEYDGALQIVKNVGKSINNV